MLSRGAMWHLPRDCAEARPPNSRATSRRRLGPGCTSKDRDSSERTL